MGTTATGRPRSSGRSILLDRSKVGVQIDEEPIEVRTGPGLDLRLLHGRRGLRLRCPELFRPFLGIEVQTRIGIRYHVLFIFAFYSL